MEVNKKTIFLLIVVLIIIVIIVFLIIKFGQNKTKETNDNLSEPRPEVIKVSKEDYQKELKQALDSLMADPANPVVVSGVREKILDLSVPGSYRQLHLDLVLTLDRLLNNQSAIKDIEEIINNNEWLK